MDDNKELSQINKKLDDLLTCTGDIARLATMVEKHDRVLRGGNGDGLGLSSRVASLEKIACENHDILFGEDDKPGLKGSVQALAAKVQTLTDKFANYDKFVWFAVTAIIGTLISVWVK